MGETSPAFRATGTTHEYDAELGFVFDVKGYDDLLHIEYPPYNEIECVLTPAVAERLYHFLKTHFEPDARKQDETHDAKTR